MRAFLVVVMALWSGCAPCTLIGCADELTVFLGAQAAQFGDGEAVTVKTCVDADCVTETLTRLADGGVQGGQTLTLIWQSGVLTRRLGTPPAAGAHRVSLSLSKGGNVVFDSTREGVTFQASTPNGPGCGPTCASATVTL